MFTASVVIKHSFLKNILRNPQNKKITEMYRGLCRLCVWTCTLQAEVVSLVETTPCPKKHPRHFRL